MKRKKMPGKTKKSSVEVSSETADRQSTTTARRRAKPSAAKTESAPPRAAGARRARAKANGSRQTGSATRLDLPPVAVEPAQLREEITCLAYSFWEQRGRQGGSPEDDWFRAEREILGRRPAQANP